MEQTTDCDRICIGIDDYDLGFRQNEPRRNERRLKARLKIKGHHAARPRGALIATRTQTPYATPPPRGLSTWGDDQTVRATI